MRRIVAFTGLLVALGAAVAGGIHSSDRSNAPARTNKPVFFGAPPPNSLPFPDAVAEPDFATAEAVLGWHIVRPHTCYADDNKVATIYVSPTGEQTDVVYQDLNSQSHCSPFEQTGHVEVLEHQSAQVLSSNTSPTLAQEAQAEVAGLGPSTWVQTVAGVPAVVIQGNYLATAIRQLQGRKVVSPLDQTIHHLSSSSSEPWTSGFSAIPSGPQA